MDWIIDVTLKEAVQSLVKILACLSVFFEFTPIKISPITSILSWIGNRANKDLIDRVAKLEEQVAGIKADDAERNAITCRVRILRFGDELIHGVAHQKDSFDQVLQDCDEYDRYCLEHPDFKNNQTVATKKKILDKYSECIDCNNFL